MISGRILSLDRPFAPVVEIRLKVQMNEPVAQRPWHGKMDTALGSWITGGDDNPPFGQQVFAEFPVEHQLITTGLGHLRRGGQLVEKENALAGIGEKLGGNPFRLILDNSGQSPEIDRVKLHGAHIEKVIVEIVSDLGDNLRLSNAARAPDVERHTFADQRMKRLIELRWFHGIFSIGWKCGGNELVVRYDIGLGFSRLLECRFQPECRFELQMGRMSGLDVRVNPGSCSGRSAKHWPTYQYWS